MSTPLSYASHALNLEKDQKMPNQPRAKKAAKAAPAAAAPAATAAASAAAAKPTPAKAAAPKPAPAKKAPAAADSEEEDADASPLPTRAAPAPRVFKSGFAMVKAVPSGDSLTLAGSSVSGGVGVPERTITLTGIIAPKFGRGPTATDEPFAWEAREYLRKHVIGKQVQFTVQHTAESSAREYGTVSLQGTDIATQMLKAGWAKVKPTPPGKDGAPGKVHPEKEPLLALEAEAAARGLGMHRKGADLAAHTRTIDWKPDVQALFAANKGKPINGVVDQVRDGSTLRVELLHPSAPMKHMVITLNLAGVSCPRTPFTLAQLQKQHEQKLAENPNFKGPAPTKKDVQPADPIAEEAQTFTEDRLLNRDVQVVLQGVDKSGNLFGSVLFAKGNITAKLLELGYGKLVPWSASLTAEAELYKQAEAKAKAARLRIWAKEDATAAASSPSSSMMSEFHGKVLNVPSSDSLVIEDANGQEVRVWLASVRAPRLAARGANSKDEPYAQEAKEFLRSRLIGHKVRVIPEYVRASAAEDTRQPRTMATVIFNKLNVNEALISAGYAEAMQHRMDEERSQFYDLYIAAEAAAKAANRGKHDPREHIVTKVTDLTERVRGMPKRKPAKKAATAEDGAEADGEEEEKEDKPAPPTKAETEAMTKSKQLSAKAKQYLVFLQREKQVNAVVEFVFSASRFKLLVPKENVMISFALAGVRTPAPKGADGKPDPFAEEVLQYVRSKIQQHSVKIEVETMDKADNFLGSLFHNRVNLAVDLLQQGYASIFGFSATRSPYSKELFAAERAAKEARKGLWKDWVEPTPEEKAAAGGDYNEETKESGPTDRVARITEIVDATDFYVQWVGDKNAEVVEQALATVSAQPESTDAFQPPANAKDGGRGLIAAGQFSDDSWHRVRLDSKNAEGDWHVTFIDFGNQDLLLADRIRALPAEAQKIPPLAVHCSLAGVVAPRAVEYQEGSALAFSEMAFGLDLNAKVLLTDKFTGRKHVILSHESHPISVNRQLLRDGWVKVGKARGLSKTMLDEFEADQQHAKHHHYNMFEYGDVSDAEDEGAEKVRGPDPAARSKKPLETKKR